MPVMSGFELLSVVRRRFTHLAVIAISGHSDGATPGGAIADAFFSKAQYSREISLQKVWSFSQGLPVFLVKAAMSLAQVSFRGSRSIMRAVGSYIY